MIWFFFSILDDIDVNIKKFFCFIYCYSYKLFKVGKHTGSVILPVSNKCGPIVLMQKVFTCFLLLFLLLTHGFAENHAKSSFSSSAVKAAFLYNFLLFTDWPESAFSGPDETIVIGIFGKDPFGDVFKAVEGKTVNDKKLVVRRFKEGTPPEALRYCHLLFLNPSQQTDMIELIGKLKGFPVLTVSEQRTFLESGGMVRLFVKNNQVKFEVNQITLKLAGMNMRSRLLRLASRVIHDPDASDFEKRTN